jgi:RND superfamily putative drug exporter
VTSLADGSYIVAVPAPGTYLLAATSPAHTSRARQVDVGEGPLVYDVELAGVAEGEVDAVDRI